MRTAIIGADGKVFKLYRGNEWKPEEILAEVRTLVRPTASPVASPK
jgi:cytochrome oxidase Cu insertion factor (SCO1/SenC/PrrC family)